MYLRREDRRVNGLRGIRCGSPWKSSYLFFECQVPSSMFQMSDLVLQKVSASIIREMDYPRIGM